MGLKLISSNIVLHNDKLGRGRNLKCHEESQQNQGGKMGVL